MSKPTPTHLKKRSVTDYYIINNEIKYKNKTTYFCGPAKNMTISAGVFRHVTCEKCLKALKEFRSNE